MTSLYFIDRLLIILMGIPIPKIVLTDDDDCSKIIKAALGNKIIGNIAN